MTNSRAKYFQEYNKKQKNRTIRFNENLFEEIENEALLQNSSFHKTVLKLLENALDKSKKDCNKTATKLQQFYKFFLKNVDNLDFNEEDIKMFKEVEGIINV